ncbi:MAG: BrnA antitoxin family protein [Acidobacteria bacterium]|nr:BrnA antitoxin family protein [Acidobacteriota bacterium]
MTDQEIQALQRIATRQQDPNYDYVANDPLTPDQLANMVRFRDVPRKVAVSVRLDPQVLAWLKSKGTGHLTRINDILLNLMDAESRSR